MLLEEEGLDTGPILMQQARASFEAAVELFEELATGGAPLVVKTLEGLEAGLRCTCRIARLPRWLRY